MMWKQLLAASALAACSTAAATRALMIDGCPDGTYPVSVLDDPKVHCLSGRPCSGAYSIAGIPQGVGACPGNTGCALLPMNEAIMGCVPSGRGDVAYVNADGSLTRGGKVVSLQSTAATATDESTTTNNNDANNKADSAKTTTNSNNNNNNNSGSSTTSSPAAAATATVAPSNLDGMSNPSSTAQTPSQAVGSQVAGSTTDATSTPSAGGLRGSKAGSGSMDNVPSPSPTATPTATPTVTPTATPTATPTPTPSVENVTAQQTLADIDGDSKANKGATNTAGVSITSIIGIVVGCLAVVAVVAGVRLLKKDKEAVVATPEGNLDDYGGGITPKEDVVLL